MDLKEAREEALKCLYGAIAEMACKDIGDLCIAVIERLQKVAEQIEAIRSIDGTALHLYYDDKGVKKYDD